MEIIPPYLRIYQQILKDHENAFPFLNVPKAKAGRKACLFRQPWRMILPQPCSLLLAFEAPLYGVNWFGFETCDCAPHGLWSGRSIEDKTWQDRFVDYLKEKRVKIWFYWSLNPNSEDTGGILQEDWKTPVEDKINLLKRLMDVK